MADESILGLLFEISADPSKALAATGEFRDKASQALREFEEQMISTMTKSLGITKEFGLGMAVGTGAVIGLGAAVFELANHAAELGEKIYAVSERTGITAESLSGLNAVAKINNENFDALSVALGRATVNMEKLIDSGGAASSELAKIMGGAKGLSELGLQPMEIRLQETLKRIFELNDVGERNSALSELMGRGWQGNVETLKFLAEEGFAPAIEKAKELGIFFDAQGAAAAKQFEMSLATLKAEMESLTNSIGQHAIPVVSIFVEWIRDGGPFHSGIGSIIKAEAEWGVETQKLINEHHDLKAAQEAELRAGEEWIKQERVKIEDAKFFADILDKNIKEQDDAQKKLYASVLKEQEEEQKGWNAHVKMDEESRKADEQLLKDREKLTAEEKKFRQSAYNDIFAFAAHAEDQVTKDLERNTRERVKIILDGFKQEEKASKEEVIALIDDIRLRARAEKQARDEKKQLDQAEFTALEGILSATQSLFQKNHDAEIAFIIAKAAIGVTYNISKGLSALGDAALGIPGAEVAAVNYFASAAEYAIVAGTEVASSGSSAGSSGGGSALSPAASSAPTFGTPLAAGAVPGGGTYHVIVMGDKAGAAHIAGLVDSAVRFGSAQLTATRTRGKQ